MKRTAKAHWAGNLQEGSGALTTPSKILNKTNIDYNEVTFQLIAPEGKIILVGKETIQVPAQKLAKGTLFVEIHPKFLEGDKTKIWLEVWNGDQKIETTTTNFMGPRSF